jgi:hypothetical protein
MGMYAAGNLTAYVLNGKTAPLFYSDENFVLHINITLYRVSKYK